jgi:hypothetical protein
MACAWAWHANFLRIALVNCLYQLFIDEKFCSAGVTDFGNMRSRLKLLQNDLFKEWRKQ